MNLPVFIELETVYGNMHATKHLLNADKILYVNQDYIYAEGSSVELFPGTYDQIVSRLAGAAPDTRIIHITQKR